MPRKLSEERTRKEMIDPQLERAGWYLRDHSKINIEIPVDGYDAEPWNGVSDYCLYRNNGEVLAVMEAIQQGQKIDDWQLLELERALTKELGLVRQVLDMQYLPDYKDLVARQFETYVTQHNYNADQIRFLRAAQSVFLQKRHLETADASTGSAQRLYEPPLDMFGADAVERWFTEKEVKEIVVFANRMAIQ